MTAATILSQIARPAENAKASAAPADQKHQCAHSQTHILEARLAQASRCPDRKSFQRPDDRRREGSIPGDSGRGHRANTSPFSGW